jgi:hypothetical protein
VISTSQLNDALQWIRSGEACGLDYIETQRSLTESAEYVMLLQDAAVVDFHMPSVEAGVIAGLRLATLLFEKELKFVEAE